MRDNSSELKQIFYHNISLGFFSFKKIVVSSKRSSIQRPRKIKGKKWKDVLKLLVIRHMLERLKLGVSLTEIYQVRTLKE